MFINNTVHVTMSDLLLYLSNAQDCWHYWDARMGSHKVKMELDKEKRERIRVP